MHEACASCVAVKTQNEASQMARTQAETPGILLAASFDHNLQSGLTQLVKSV